MNRSKPPLLFAFVGMDERLPDKAVSIAEDAAGAWLQEQNPRILGFSTDLTHADGLWCFVITITWTTSDGEPRAVQDFDRISRQVN